MPGQFSGPRVASLVALLVVLTAVIPPAAAYGLARWRITQADTLARDAAPRLGERRAMLQAAVGGKDVVCGPGRVPAGQGPGEDWVRSTVITDGTFAGVWPQDPWGRCYLLNARALFERGAGLLLSAGPNGTIDTPLHAVSPSGDDIAAMVR